MRRPLRWASYLAAATLVSVAIAWLLAVGSPKGDENRSRLYRMPDGSWTWIKYRRFGYARVEFARPPVARADSPLSLDLVADRWLDGVPFDPEASRLGTLESRIPDRWTMSGTNLMLPQANSGSFFWAEAFGWPLPCAKCNWYEVLDDFRAAGGVRISHSVDPVVDELRAIPLVPIWTGLLTDSALLALLFMGARTLWCGLSRALRVRRGRCPVCRYDLRADANEGCPECGWRRRPVLFVTAQATASSRAVQEQA